MCLLFFSLIRLESILPRLVQERKARTETFDLFHQLRAKLRCAFMEIRRIAIAAASLILSSRLL